MFLLCMHTNHGIHMLPTYIHTTPFMLMCTHVHIADVRATLQNFVIIGYMIQILQTNLFGLGKELTPMDPKEYKYQKSLLFYLM